MNALNGVIRHWKKRSVIKYCWNGRFLFYHSTFRNDKKVVSQHCKKRRHKKIHFNLHKMSNISWNFVGFRGFPSKKESFSKNLGSLFVLYIKRLFFAENPLKDPGPQNFSYFISTLKESIFVLKLEQFRNCANCEKVRNYSIWWTWQTDIKFKFINDPLGQHCNCARSGDYFHPKIYLVFCHCQVDH